MGDPGIRKKSELLTPSWLVGWTPDLGGEGLRLKKDPASYPCDCEGGFMSGGGYITNNKTTGRLRSCPTLLGRLLTYRKNLSGFAAPPCG